MKNSIITLLPSLALALILAACAPGNPATNPQAEDQVATVVASTLAVMSAQAPTVEALPPSAKLEDFPNKAFIGENDRFSVFVLDPTDPNSPEQIGQIIIYNNGTQTVYEIVGTFRVLTSTPIFNDDLGEYVLLSVGTYTSRTAIVISLSDKKQAVNDFCTSSGAAGSQVFWNDYVIYNNCDTFSNRPWGAGEAPSVMAVNLKTGVTTEIAKSDALRQFTIKRVTGNTLQYEETSVASEADWSNPNNQVKTDKTYDLSTLNQ